MLNDDDSKSAQASWEPPTPRSTFKPLPSLASTLPVDHLVLLPSPILSHDDSQSIARSDDGAGEQRATPSSLRGASEPSLLASPPDEQDDIVDDFRDADWIPTAPSAKRPRRSAAIAAARNIPRQPSPLDLEGGNDADFDAESASASPPPRTGESSSRDDRRGATASRRKVSHSLIERRRREKINECLAVLRETVPDLREEGERKVARAKERGRKRGRGQDAGERGGLHKLEIIEQLRRRVAELEASQTSVQLRSPESSAGFTSSSKGGTASTGVKGGAYRSPERAPSRLDAPSLSSAGTVDDHEASLLLLEFSTSPELRPVVV
ncbi:hypothetical protein DMC30DRAFT_389078 [Rhodotorula diobovata]|uniref:BHLH domain-containing protein n=1 Tax=Rhodotorula diobovata TaxID=5288 RepID=A0A5C5G3F5_9BASI|nr:hypothetical protein DMC30DRAFT_389078 [Rhodotorula diobovata]